MTDKNIKNKRCLLKDSNEDFDSNWKVKNKNKKAKVGLMKSNSRKNSKNKKDVPFKKKKSSMSAIKNKNILYKHHLSEDSSDGSDCNWNNENKNVKKVPSRKTKKKQGIMQEEGESSEVTEDEFITSEQIPSKDSSDNSDSKENENKSLKMESPLSKKGSSKKIKKKLGIMQQESEFNEITEDENITYERYLPEDSSSDDSDSNWTNEKKSMKKVSSKKRKRKQGIMEKEGKSNEITEEDNITYKRYLSEDSSDDNDSNLSDDDMSDDDMSDDDVSNDDVSDDGEGDEDVSDEDDEKGKASIKKEELLNNLHKEIERIKKGKKSNKQIDYSESKENNDSDQEASGEVQLPMIPYHTGIKNKMKKHQEFAKFKGEVKLAKKNLKELKEKERRVLGKEVKKKVPHTIESKREEDLTNTNNDDEDLITEEATDNYAKYYAKQYEPKVLITASNKIHGRTIKFVRELVLTLPNADAHWRNKSTIQKLIKAAIAKQYTDIIIVNEDRRAPTGLLLIHLPKGPTALFRLSNVKLCKDVKRRAKDITGHRPELILNNFNTRLGRVIARMFGALFHYEPEFKGRSVCTFHNQRDYIFFRHHRYQFSHAEKARLKELGPRFTLRLEWLKDGAFDGDFEWIQKRHEMETSRRKFNL